ncbi:GNAT family N-acetyltransferase [Longimicrobium terrae]|uniref:GNAT superfamily N-acetyltransferase n=1 Tax=Longimicrobium terrae TaxID=1639882 RepID=A0A841GPB8_9BACT|nr:GNAT superfamily N-acetyltransferase [Longimicrobium terrae]MBB6069192.1 GNAT superfamily N-acetyltransferase [Longimicrobium terrae]NNC31996.1 GNAT family N-acetyltransferase [Longimicrobium terrae]
MFILLMSGAPVVSAPPHLVQALASRVAAWTPASVSRPAALLAALTDLGAHEVIGPAFIGYADSVAGPAEPATRPLTGDDAPWVEALKAACSPEEWEHGGSDIAGGTAVGVFVDGRLAALAGYEVWDGCIAHLAIVTAPAYRGRGLGRAAVGAAARAAVQRGLVAQYRTLDANAASVRIAHALGFVRFATSVSVRLA